MSSFFQKLVDKVNDEVNFENIRKTNEENPSVKLGWFTFNDIYSFLISSLDAIVKTQLIKVTRHWKIRKKKMLMLMEY